MNNNEIAYPPERNTSVRPTNEIISLPDDKTINEEQILSMLKYNAIYDALHNDEISVHEALVKASLKKYIHPVTGKEYTFSLRTLYRYLKNYNTFNMEGLKRSIHKNKGRSKVIPAELSEKIFSLKQELPTRSVPKIIRLLELSGEVKPGLLKERTVSRLLKDNGYTRKALRLVKQHYKKINVDKIYDLYVSDIKETWIKDEHDKTHKIYLFIIMDYHSGRVVHAQAYSDGILLRLEDCFKKAIVKFGLPTRLYVDNGVTYIANNFKFACADLGVKLIYASAYWPQGKGAVEKFIQFCEQDFLSELKINPIRDITKLNTALWGWVEKLYNQKSHEGIENQTPLEVRNKSLNTGITPRFVSPIEIANAFYHQVKRKVNTYGVISFETNTYEVDVALIGETVIVKYDPLDLKKVYIYHKDKFACTAKLIDLTREQHTQYRNIKKNNEFDPKINIDYPQLMAKHYQTMLKDISNRLVKGNQDAHQLEGNTKNYPAAKNIKPSVSENTVAVEDETMARPGFTVQEKKSAITLNEYLDVIKSFLHIENLSYQQKELLHKYYHDFEIFNKSLLEKTLLNLGDKCPDSKDNLLYYLNMIKTELNKD